MDGLRRSLAAAPDVLVLALLAVTIAVGAAVTVRAFVPWVVLPVAAAVAVGLWRLRPDPVPGAGAWALGAVLALAGAAVWTVVQVRLAGENIVVDRDPAVYALTGIWLSDHPSVAVPMTDALRATSGIDSATTVALGFGRSLDPLQPEANHTVPGLVALSGWVGGIPAVLAANAAIAGIALVSLYAAARRLVGPLWGLLPPTVLALSMPMVVLGRSTYSEPLAVAMVCGAVAVLAATLRRTDWAARPQPWLLAGLYVGAVALARVDGGLALIGAVLVVGAAAVLAPAPPRQARRALTALGWAGAALLGLGLLDLALNSGNYLTRGRETVGVVAIVLGLAAAVGLARWSIRRAERWHAWVARHAERLGQGLALGSVLLSVLLLSRPLWLTSRLFAGSEGFERDIARYQQAEGLPVDGARSYGELTLTWVSWYHGWLLVLLGLAGVAAMLLWTVRDRRLPLLAALLPLGVPALVYVVYPNITPDQVWASRRLVVGAVPLLLLAATLLLRSLARHSRLGTVVAVVAAATVLVWPTTTFSGLYIVRDRVGQVAETQAGCARIPDGRVVVAGSRPGFDYIATPRIVCDAQVVQMTRVSRDDLADLVAGWGGEPLTLLTFEPQVVPWTRPPAGPIHRSSIASWERSLIDPPARAPVQQRALWAGVVQPDGRVEPIEP
jgi:hypothetical protein